MEIRDRHVLVTGASRGIGAAIAREFESRGARVSLVARSAGPLEELATQLAGYALPCDLFDDEQVRGLVARAEAAAGPVDVLVNNAGMEYTKSFFDTTEREIDDVVRLNFTVPMQLARMVVPGMRERRRGHILNISSMAANGGFPGLAVYCGTKSGLSHFGRILREDLKGTGIGVTNLEVGPVPTELLENMEYEPTLKSFARLRRMQLMPNVSAERVALCAVDGVERGKRAVWLPKRAFLFGALVGAPQRIVAPLLVGIKRS
jgi:short-subunit dehydrogenase